MRIGQVIGTLVTPVHHPAYDGLRLLAVRPLDPDGELADDRMFVAVDRAQAGVGDRVLLMAEGSSVRDLLEQPGAPVRCAVVGVIDEIECHGQRCFPSPEPT